MVLDRIEECGLEEEMAKLRKKHVLLSFVTNTMAEVIEKVKVSDNISDFLLNISKRVTQ